MYSAEPSVDTAHSQCPVTQSSSTMPVVLNIDKQQTSEKELEAGATPKYPSGEDINIEPVSADISAASVVDDDLATYTLTKRQLISAVASVVVLFFIATLDSTVMASIYVPVASEFDALGQAVWIITTYMLSSTVVQAIIGKVSDILGRVETILTSIFIFLVGSVLCSASQSINMLIAGRTIQGLGGGGLIGLGTVLMGDLFSERERGKYVGIFAAAFAVSTVVGPVMGGGIVQHASWRIVFWINIPICVIAMAMIFFTLKLPKTQGTLREKIRRVDFIGCALFTIGMVPILLGLSWGGQQYEWTSAPVLACLIAGFVVILVFLFVEYRFAAEPIVPVRLFGNVNVLAALASAFTMGATMVGATLSIPSWEMAVKHASTISAGAHVIPLGIGFVIASPLTGVYMSRYGRFLLPLRFGAVLATAGALLLLRYKTDTGLGERLVYLFMIGLGLGQVSQPTMIVCQASVAGKYMASVTTSYSFTRTLGSILSTSIFNSILNSHIKTGVIKLASEFPEYAAAIVSTRDDQRNIYKDTTPSDIRTKIIKLWADSMHSAFFSLVVFGGVFLVCCFAIKHVELGKKRKKTIE